MVTFKDFFIHPLLKLRDSDNSAFYIGNELYSYKSLFDYVEQVYDVLGGCKDKVVGVYATDDIRTYASIVALWYWGKAYVPLNPNQP